MAEWVKGKSVSGNYQTCLLDNSSASPTEVFLFRRTLLRRGSCRNCWGCGVVVESRDKVKVNDNPYRSLKCTIDESDPLQLSFDFAGLAVGSLFFAGIGFVLGLLGSFFAHDVTWPKRFAMAGATALIAFVASFAALFVLCALDHMRIKSALRSVRRTLLARPNMDMEHFHEELSQHDPAILAVLRASFARFLQVPTSKVYPTDSFMAEFRSTGLDLTLRAFVVTSAMRELNAPEPDLAGFNSAKSFSDIASLFEGHTD